MRCDVMCQRDEIGGKKERMKCLQDERELRSNHHSLKEGRNEGRDARREAADLWQLLGGVRGVDASFIPLPEGVRQERIPDRPQHS